MAFAETLFNTRGRKHQNILKRKIDIRSTFATRCTPREKNLVFVLK